MKGELLINMLGYWVEIRIFWVNKIMWLFCFMLIFCCCEKWGFEFYFMYIEICDGNGLFKCFR